MFKDNKGAWRTKSLFVEWLGVEDQEKWDAPFTLKENDTERRGRKYKSLYQLFISSVDEYDFAVKHLGGYAHLEQLKKAKWFCEGHRTHRGYNAWLDELGYRDESLAKRAVIAAVNDGDTAAAKKLWDMSKKPAETKRGRFVKDEAKKEAAKKVNDDELLSDAALRLNVVPIRD